MWLKSSPSWSQKIILQPFEVVNLNENEVSKMNKMPGFTAELSLTRKGSYYERFAAHIMASPGLIQPAVVMVPRTICWCAEEGMVEVDVNPLTGFGRLVEDCLRMECIMVPIVYGL